MPAELREKLKKEVSLEINAQITPGQKSDSQKALIIFDDDEKVETVLMKHKDGRNTVCVSSQVGCPLGCSFCATGKIGFKRNLVADEIVEQAVFWGRMLKKESKAGVIARKPEFVRADEAIPRNTFEEYSSESGSSNSGLLRRPSAMSSGSNDSRVAPRNDEAARIHGVVFMGMGEPFLNYENVLAAIRILNDKDGLNIGARHISISTAGIIEGIKKLAEEPMQINLALSLHAPNDKLRESLMPIAKKYSVKEIFETLDEHTQKTNRRVMIEYIMIKDKNDSDECAKELAGLIKKMKKPLVFVNLILYNPSGRGFFESLRPTGIFKPSSGERTKAFKAILEKEGIEAVQRWRFGDEIGGACGQLIVN
ncbi:MAG: putative dual-specificity RNA methyltransferase RlmN [Parcubacteria group bacterium GW2011_GWB1_42_6]|nr:MAG: putative dual-specificity RNA methyltransferase RlmN [Parcubacteria group bacterium GW2011_GWB1_42_6]